MTEPLVDPLIPFFRPAAAPLPPLLLSRSDMRLWLMPHLARLHIRRTFTNGETVPIEAVLTMPPALDGEIVHGLTVTIGDESWTARARAKRRGEGEYDSAAVDGNRAFLLEEARQGWRVLSVTGVRPGESVSIDCDSVVELGSGISDLMLRPGTDPNRSVSRLPDHQTPRATDQHHPMTLTIWAAEGISVESMGRNLPIGIPVSLDGAPLTLRVEVPFGIQTRTERMPAELAAQTALNASRQIAILMAGAVPIDGQAIRTLALSANLLTAETSLVFVGSEGEASGILPTMRKVALVDRPGALAQPAIPEATPPSEPEPPFVDEPPIRPGRFGLRFPRFGLPSWDFDLASPRTRAPRSVQLSNWIRHRLYRSKPIKLSQFGARIVAAAPAIFWRQDGVLALRSGDANHLPTEIAALVREVAAIPVVIATGHALQLTPEQLVIGLLALAASKHSEMPPGLLGYLFPDNPSALPLPFSRLARQMGIA